MASGVSASAINVLDQLTDLLSVLPGLIKEFDLNRFNTHDEVILQCMERRVTELCSILYGLNADLLRLIVPTGHGQIFEEIISTFDEAIGHVWHYKVRFQELLEWHLSSQHCIDSSQFHLACDVGTTDTVGRARVLLSKEQVSSLISLGLTFEYISKMLGVHPKTLWKLRQEWNLPVGRGVLTDITDHQLNESIQDVQK